MEGSYRCRVAQDECGRDLTVCRLLSIFFFSLGEQGMMERGEKKVQAQQQAA